MERFIKADKSPVDADYEEMQGYVDTHDEYFEENNDDEYLENNTDKQKRRVGDVVWQNLLKQEKKYWIKQKPKNKEEEMESEISPTFIDKIHIDALAHISNVQLLRGGKT